MKTENAILISLIILMTSTIVSGSKTSLLAKMEERIEEKLQDVSTVVTKWLETFNDRQLIGTSLGKLLQYEKIKTQLTLDGTARSKKMSMSMMTLVFHLGAMSTWLLLTAVMATKSVAIGALLLGFKIAIIAAKLSSLFSGLKGKKKHVAWTPPVYYEHSIEPPVYMDSPATFEGYSYDPPAQGVATAGSYSPDWSPSQSGVVSGISVGYYYK